MFEPIQSDYWYIEDTDDILLCTVSSVLVENTDPCRGDSTSIYPVIYKINRESNKKKIIYPTESDYSYSTIPNISANVDITEMSKPQISYNKTNNIYNISFTGKYSDNDLGIFTYFFQYVSDSMHLLDSHAFIPESKFTGLKHTFENGYLHPDYIIKGNTVKSLNSVDTLGVAIGDFAYLPPDYQFRPFHYGNDLKFATTLYSTVSTESVANSAAPLSYAGGFIAQKRSVAGVSTENCIRIDFTCKCYSLTNQPGFYTEPVSGYRQVSLYGFSTSATDGEGFCVFLYEDIDKEPIQADPFNPTGVGSTSIVGIGSTEIVIDPDQALSLNGVGVTMGYVPASASVVEYNAPALSLKTSGMRNNGFLGICFDIGGYFCTTENGMPESYDGTTYTRSVSTIGVRGGKINSYKVLSRSNTISGADVKLHERVATEQDAVYRDFRVELVNKGTYLKILGKLSTDSTYITLHTVNLKDYGYNETNIPRKLKAGLSFNTTNRLANFELKKFKVEGVAAKEFTTPPLITNNSATSLPGTIYNTPISQPIIVGAGTTSDTNCCCYVGAGTTSDTNCCC